MTRKNPQKSRSLKKIIVYWRLVKREIAVAIQTDLLSKPTTDLSEVKLCQNIVLYFLDYVHSIWSNAWFLVMFGEIFLHLPLVSFEGDLEDSVTEGVAVEGLDGHQGLVVVRHGDEAKALALVCL